MVESKNWNLKRMDNVHKKSSANVHLEGTMTDNTPSPKIQDPSIVSVRDTIPPTRVQSIVDVWTESLGDSLPQATTVPMSPKDFVGKTNATTKTITYTKLKQFFAKMLHDMGKSGILHLGAMGHFTKVGVSIAKGKPSRKSVGMANGHVDRATQEVLLPLPQRLSQT